MIRDDAGQIGGIEAVVFGVLVFVIGTLVVANAWGVIDAKLAASAAAREAARTFVESRASSTDAALTEAEAAARDAIAGQGRDPGAMSFVPESASLRRCARVTIRVDYPVPLVVLPFLGHGGHGFTASGRHSEIVDPYRSGLNDTDSCGASVAP
ncbi:MAG TPA: hypothetical protein VHN98_03440 [Acidimicrobiales bacterium]|nr:hypothetical protein [Acidimicrobiales bacterium]